MENKLVITKELNNLVKEYNASTDAEMAYKLIPYKTEKGVWYYKLWNKINRFIFETEEELVNQLNFMIQS